jgi:hypothetical protein
MGQVVSLNISKIRGVDKNIVFSVNAIKNWGKVIDIFIKNLN